MKKRCINIFCIFVLTFFMTSCNIADMNEILNSLNDSSTDIRDSERQTILETMVNNSEDNSNSINTNINKSIGQFFSSDFDQVIESGTYKVGTDIDPGLYVGFGPQQWTGSINIYTDASRNNQSNSGFNLDNNFLFVNLNEGEIVEITDFFIIPFTELEDNGLENFGIFIGGETLPIGEYCLSPYNSDVNGEYKIYTDFNEEDRIYYNYYPAHQYITIQENQILVISNTTITSSTNQQYIVNEENDTFGEILGANVYRVGLDIQPGVYVAYGPSQWTTSVNIYKTSVVTEEHEIILFNYCEILNLKQGEYVDVAEDAFLVPYEQIEHMDSEKTGIYVVGEDIEVGEYKLITQSSNYDGYWAIYTALNQRFKNHENYFSNQDYIEIAENQILVLQNAYLEKQ